MTARVLLAAVLLGSLLSGCSGSEEPGDPEPSTSPSADGASPTARPSAAAVPAPETGACYRLTYAEALAPTVDAEPVPCARRHTARTFAVGELDTVVDGHLLAVDSARVRRQVATTCPRRLGGFLGGTEDDRRLSMLRAVWFTPTLEESDQGARWFRCDVIAVAGPDRLAPLARRVAGALGRPAGRDRYGMCGTAAPDAPAFARVVCSAAHSWRAVAVVDLPAGRYPGAGAVRQAGQTPCEDAGRAAATDPLDFRWGYEWPTPAQWADGQTYGLCWVPD
ncbi:septum formation family protein [Nocardioides dongkuii]|uniref:septum formation family protein n=1 Tax=Nocardioides dongkuii TaxID=2760089 RepID=UPI0015FBCF95|nr:septum formation family protein [Nocardioides dongkuii]